MNGHGEGMSSVTTTSINAGPESARVLCKTGRNSSGVRTLYPARPKLSAS